VLPRRLIECAYGPNTQEREVWGGPTARPQAKLPDVSRGQRRLQKATNDQVRPPNPQKRESDPQRRNDKWKKSAISGSLYGPLSCFRGSGGLSQ
jgi:hypothetical protein